MKFRRLFSSVRIGNMLLSNRIVMAPMATNFATSGGEASDQLIAYYRERAKGRPGLIITESCYVNRAGRGAVRRLSLAQDCLIPSHMRLTAEIHKEGIPICAQLHHAGATAPMSATGEYPVSCSATVLPSKGHAFVGVIPRKLSVEEIRETVADFGRAAARAWRAGYDAVQIHAAHGYLINQFLSPHTNKRTDMYGGSDENRMRFLIDVVREVRRNVPSDFPVLCRLSGTEFVDGGYQVEFIAQLVAALESEGVDEISISCGNYEQIELIAPIFPSPKGCYAYLSEVVRKEVRIPISVAGRISTPELAEEILNSEKADLVCLGRELIADPLWPLKAATDAANEIRPCIYCNRGCFDRMMAGEEIRCSVNPFVGMEYRNHSERLSSGRRLLVVGGGPAGMQVATVAAEYGYEVHLAEKSQQLGGKLQAASIPPGKEDLENWRLYLVDRINKLGVRVYLSESDYGQLMKSIDPDLVVMATGSVPTVPKIPGIEREIVTMAEDVLLRRKEVGDRVVVLGGGMVGIETALFLADAGKKVVVVEVSDDVLTDMGAGSKKVLLQRAGEAGVRILVGAQVSEVGPREVHVDNACGSQTIGADSVVLAVGYKHVQVAALGDQCSCPVVVIGDARSPGTLLDISLALQDMTQLLMRPCEDGEVLASLSAPSDGKAPNDSSAF